MAVRVYCQISNQFGSPLARVSGFFILDYILNCAPGAVGVLELTLPPTFNLAFLVPDGQIGVYRSIDGRSPYLDNGAIYLIETIKVTSKSILVRAFHANILTTRRYVLYANGSTFANKSATFADNQLKAYWRENAGNLIDVSREGVQTQADLSAYVSTQADQSLGPAIAMQGAHDPLDSVLQRICDASNTAGTYLTYEILNVGGTLTFCTYTVARGLDRRSGTASPMILSERRGNLIDAELTTDYHSEVTVAVAAGQGQNSERVIATSLDTTRMGVSPFHRIERVFEAANVFDATVIQDAADAAKRDNRPIISIGGKLVDTPSSVRGIHYDLGDLMSVEAPVTGELIDVRLDLVHEHYDASGSQSGQDLTGHQVAHRYAVGGLRSV